MIRVQSNVVGEAQIMLRFANGWTAAIAPHPQGTAALAAWPTHDDVVPLGRLHLSGGVTGGADDVVAFLTEISSRPVAAPSQVAAS